VTHAQAITDGETALATIEIAVPPQRAFDAMTSAEVEKWWAAPGLYHFANWQSDLRVGGRWHVNVCLPNGTVLPAGGEYLIVQAPHRVTLTRRYDWDHPTLGRQVTRVTYRFEPIKGGTRITVRQEEFGSPEAAREHAVGWERTLNLLPGYLVRSAVQDDAGRAASSIAIDRSDDAATMISTIRAELRDPAEPLALLVRFAVEPGDSRKVEAAFARARSLTLSEPGCRAYELNRDPRDQGRFAVYEQWRALADLEAHFQRDYFSVARDEINALIVGTPEFQVVLPTA